MSSRRFSGYGNINRRYKEVEIEEDDDEDLAPSTRKSSSKNIRKSQPEFKIEEDSISEDDSKIRKSLAGNKRKSQTELKIEDDDDDSFPMTRKSFGKTKKKNHIELSIEEDIDSDDDSKNMTLIDRSKEYGRRSQLGFKIEEAVVYGEDPEVHNDNDLVPSVRKSVDKSHIEFHIEEDIVSDENNEVKIDRSKSKSQIEVEIEEDSVPYKDEEVNDGGDLGPSAANLYDVSMCDSHMDEEMEEEELASGDDTEYDKDEDEDEDTIYPVDVESSSDSEEENYVDSEVIDFKPRPTEEVLTRASVISAESKDGLTYSALDTGIIIVTPERNGTLREINYATDSGVKVLMPPPDGFGPPRLYIACPLIFSANTTK